jgi:hypothetical protein
VILVAEVRLTLIGRPMIVLLSLTFETPVAGGAADIRLATTTSRAIARSAAAATTAAPTATTAAGAFTMARFLAGGRGGVAACTSLLR